MPVFEMEVNVDKRERSSNFTFEETEVLINLIEERKNLIECKKTDAVTNRSKEKEWENLTILYNSKCSQFRTTKMLRSKWESLKKITRKEVALLAQKDQIKVDGDSEERRRKNPWTDRIAGIMGEGIHGTSSSLDSSQDYEARTIHEEKPLVKEIIPSTSTQNIPLVTTETVVKTDLTTEFNTEDDGQWNTWNSMLLKQPYLEALDVQENLINESIPLVNTAIKNVPDSSSRHHFTRKKSAVLFLLIQKRIRSFLIWLTKNWN